MIRSLSLVVAFLLFATPSPAMEIVAVKPKAAVFFCAVAFTLGRYVFPYDWGHDEKVADKLAEKIKQVIQKTEEAKELVCDASPNVSMLTCSR